MPFSYKNLVLLFVFLSATICATQYSSAADAQLPLQCRLVADSVLSTHVREWVKANAVRLMVHNMTDSVQFIRLESTVLSEGKALATASAHLTEPIRVEPRADTIIPASKIFPVLLMTYSDKRHLDKHAGILPSSGDITICINVFDTSGLHAKATANCIHRNIKSYVQVSLTSPADNDTLHHTQLDLRWIGVYPRPRHCVYHLTLFARDSEAYLQQVVRTHKPLLDTLVNDTTICRWMAPQTSKVEEYVWQIRSTDGDVMPYGGIDGYSALAHFFISPLSAPPPINSKNNGPKRTTPASKKKQY